LPGKHCKLNTATWSDEWHAIGPSVEMKHTLWYMQNNIYN